MEKEVAMKNWGIEIRYLIPILGMILGIVRTAHAVDGVLEINQACAVNTGCFSGDGPLFPVTLASEGSYRLTSDLDVSVASVPANATAIHVTAHDVTVDLNGFSIRGPAACSGFPVVCSPAGGGSGVFSGHKRTVVSNGSISGMGNEGVRITNSGAVVENLRLYGNAGDCILTSLTSIVRGNTVEFCGGDGISVSFGSLVQGNVVRSCATFGIELASSTSGFTQNVLGGNNESGDQTSGGVDLGGNLCQTSTTCP
jgi:hypothetical protein